MNSWDEDAARRYQNERGRMEEEQDRIQREDRKRLEHNEQVAYELNRRMEQIHAAANGILSGMEGCDLSAAHRAIDQAADYPKQQLRHNVQEAARNLEENRLRHRRMLENLETDYRRG